MALNFTVSYTFSPSTTISSSQVNTNTSDVAAVFQGLEAETKTLAKLKVDIDPTLALEVATKQYVDHYSAYRRPVLVYSSGTVVNMETGINGTSGQAQILFPDGNLRQDSTTGRINCNLAQVAALSGSWQSGLRTGSVATNTWYAIYAVKTTDDTSKFVAVADTVLPLQANFATLNSNFGTNGWVYLGMVRNGDNSGTTNAILSFKQSGLFTRFNNIATGSAVQHMGGTVLATTAGATSVTYTYSAGTGTTAIPNHVGIVIFGYAHVATGQAMSVTNSAASATYFAVTGTTLVVGEVLGVASDGAKVVTGGSSVALDIFLCGYLDPVLGVGSNPIL